MFNYLPYVSSMTIFLFLLALSIEIKTAMYLLYESMYMQANPFQEHPL